MKQCIAVVLFCFSLMACAGSSASQPVQWHYGVGSNIDDIWASKTEFSRTGQIFYADKGKENYGAAFEKNIIGKEYYWAGGGGLPTDGKPIPHRAVLEVVSFYDQKRYRIKVDLPKDLEQRMRQIYQVDGRKERRDLLYFGLAPGEYYEVLLMGRSLGVSPDILLSRGIAEKVTDDWYDQKVPVAEQYGMDSFVRKYGELFNKHPVPSGMDWAPIMDAYRAAQPITDLKSVRE
ncbi:DUF2931 family protein [Aeromonas salmonicida]|uniref:DUF2931 family protein n=1 Tax=Aeromonas salmonicida TaxID=645 RepID=UPI00343DB13C